MAGTELATAYVQLVPSAQGIASGIAREFAPVEAAAATTGSKAGQSMSKGLLGSLGGVHGKLLATLGFASIGVALFKSAEDVEAANNIIVRSTGASGKAAESLEASFKKVAASSPASFETIAKTLAEVHQRTGLTGAGLETLTKQVVTFNRITKDSPITVQDLTRALAGFNVPASQMGATLDRLFVISQKTGVPLADLIGTLNTAGPIARQFGFSIETTAGLLAQLNKAGIDASQVMPGLRKAFIQFAKEGREPATALREVLTQMDALIKKGDIVGAQGLAVKLFGARGAGLVDAVVQGKLSLQDLNKTFDSTGRGILETADKTGTFSAKLGILKNQAKLALAEFGTPILRAATDDLKQILPITASLGSALGDIAPALTPIIIGFGAMKLASLTLTPALGFLSTGLTTAATSAEALGATRTSTALGGLATGLGNVASKLPGIIGAGVIAATTFDQIGKSSEGTIIGVAGLTIAGAQLGSMFGPVGLAAGAAGGFLLGFAKDAFTTTSASQDLNDALGGLIPKLEGVGAKKAAVAYLKDFFGGTATKGQFLGTEVNEFAHDLAALAAQSPTLAGRVVTGLQQIRTESGKPLFTDTGFRKIIGAVYEATAAFHQHAEKANEVRQGDAALAGGTTAAAAGETNLANATNNAANAASAQATELGNLNSVVAGVSQAHIALAQAVGNEKSAQDAYNAAVVQFGPDSAEAQSALLALQSAHLQVAQSTLSLDQSQAQLAATYKDTSSIDAAIARLQAEAAQNPATAASLYPLLVNLLDLRAKYQDLAAQPDIHKGVSIDGLSEADAQLSNLIAHLNTLQGVDPSIIDRINAANVPGLAVGGPVAAGAPYLVGERGPELFVPGAAGRIVPAGATAQMLGAGGATYIYNVYPAKEQITAYDLARIDRNRELLRTPARPG
jgi:hypothetical protein